MLYFRNVTQSVRSSWKQSVVIHGDQATHLFFKLINRAYILMIEHFIFFVSAGMIVDSIYDTG